MHSIMAGANKEALFQEAPSVSKIFLCLHINIKNNADAIFFHSNVSLLVGLGNNVVCLRAVQHMLS